VTGGAAYGEVEEGEEELEDEDEDEGRHEAEQARGKITAMARALRRGAEGPPGNDTADKSMAPGETSSRGSGRGRRGSLDSGTLAANYALLSTTGGGTPNRRRSSIKALRSSGAAPTQEVTSLAQAIEEAREDVAMA